MVEKIVCHSHPLGQATHICLSCEQLLCMECSFSHTIIKAEKEESKDHDLDKHIVQPLATTAAKVIENLQMSLYKKNEIVCLQEKLKELTLKLNNSAKENAKYIDDKEDMFQSAISEVKKMLSKNVAKIENTFAAIMTIFESEEKAQSIKTALFDSMQSGYQKGAYYEVYNNREKVEKVSDCTSEAISKVNEMIDIATASISEFEKSKEGLDVINLSLEEKITEWKYTMAKVWDPEQSKELRQRQFIVKANKHILLKEVQGKIKDLEKKCSEINRELLLSQAHVKKLTAYEKYIDDDTFSMLADSMMCSSSQSETLFKKLSPYIRTTPVPTKFSFKGVDIFPEGTYCGYRNQDTGKREGKGVMMYEDGRIYEGFWKNDLQWGNGRLILPSGNVYEGHFHKGKFHGYGKYIWKNGETYVGEMKNGMREGQGMLTAKGYVYLGQWNEDKLEGYGIKSWETGEVYIGEFKNDKKDGHGMYIWPEGTKLIGTWKKDQSLEDGVTYEPEMLSFSEDTVPTSSK